MRQPSTGRFRPIHGRARFCPVVYSSWPHRSGRTSASATRCNTAERVHRQAKDRAALIDMPRSLSRVSIGPQPFTMQARVMRGAALHMRFRSVTAIGRKRLAALNTGPRHLSPFALSRAGCPLPLSMRDRPTAHDARPWNSRQPRQRFACIQRRPASPVVNGAAFRAASF